MPISSRTPEGEPNRCPVCGSEVCIEPSKPTGEAPCPRCGVLLWFLALPEGVRLFDDQTAERFRGAITGVLAEFFQTSEEDAWERVTGADSLELVEVVLELEGEFGSDWDDPQRWR